MCRAKACGGRRCNHEWTTTGKVKHNQMRRDNRAIRKHAAEWAEKNGDRELAERFRQMNPGDVKQWLKDHDHDRKQFIAGVPDTALAPSTPERPAGPGIPLAQRINPPGGIHGAGGGGVPRGGGPAPAAAAGVAGPPTPRMPPMPKDGPPSDWSSQEWCNDELRPKIQAAIASQGTHRDERSLLSGRPIKSVRVADGVNTTARVELANGMVGFHKPFDGAHPRIAAGFGHEGPEESLNEVAAWQLASRMGPPYSEMVPPVVVREVDGRWGSFAVERPGKIRLPGVLHSPEWKDAALFDALVGQQDRHSGNFLVAGDRITLIDHGMTFARPGDYLNHTQFVDARTCTSDRAVLSHHESDVLRRVIASPDQLGMRQLVGEERADALKARAELMLKHGRVGHGF